jgi:DNA invertase Pin-like site-specific DNA recombinase
VLGHPGHLIERPSPLESVTEAADTTTPAGKMMFTILGAFAEMERELIAERTKAGMKVARANGKMIHRPTPRFDRVKFAMLREAGHTATEVSRQLGISETTTRRLMKVA